MISGTSWSEEMGLTVNWGALQLKLKEYPSSQKNRIRMAKKKVSNCQHKEREEIIWTNQKSIAPKFTLLKKHSYFFHSCMILPGLPGMSSFHRNEFWYFGFCVESHLYSVLETQSCKKRFESTDTNLSLKKWHQKCTGKLCHNLLHEKLRKLPINHKEPVNNRRKP